jgi:hypothetical protein
MEKLMAAIVIVLLVLALVCFGYGIGIIAGFVAYAKWHVAFSFMAGFGCILTVAGICDAMSDND